MSLFPGGFQPANKQSGAAEMMRDCPGEWMRSRRVQVESVERFGMFGRTKNNNKKKKKSPQSAKEQEFPTETTTDY